MPIATAGPSTSVQTRMGAGCCTHRGRTYLTRADTSPAISNTPTGKRHSCISHFQETMSQTASEKRRKILILGLALFGALGFLGPLLFGLYSVFTGQQQAPPQQVAATSDQTAQNQQQLAGYETVLKREPNNPTALAGAAEIYARSGQFARALPYAERLAAQQPNNPQLSSQLAQLYLVNGQPARAEAIFDRQLARNKNDLDALVRKAQLRQMLGDTRTARALLDRGIAAAPTNLKPKVKEIADQILKPPSRAPLSRPTPTGSTP